MTVNHALHFDALILNANAAKIALQNQNDTEIQYHLTELLRLVQYLKESRTNAKKRPYDEIEEAPTTDIPIGSSLILAPTESTLQMQTVQFQSKQTSDKKLSDLEEEDYSNHSEYQINLSIFKQRYQKGFRFVHYQVKDMEITYKHLDEEFFQFLGKICADEHAVDYNGKQLHHGYSVKRLARLQALDQFQIFQFRIDPFVYAFHDHVKKYCSIQLDRKEIKDYLLNQRYINRYTENNKRIRSSGHDLWTVEAKKLVNGTWTFRGMEPHFINLPPIGYPGKLFEWKPKVFDSHSVINPTFTSPSLPTWLSWQGDSLKGVPIANDNEEVEVTVICRYHSHTFTTQSSSRITHHSQHVDRTVEKTFTISISANKLPSDQVETSE